MNYKLPMPAMSKQINTFTEKIMDVAWFSAEQMQEAYQAGVNSIHHDAETVAQVLERTAYEAPISGNHLAQARVLLAAQMYAQSRPKPLATLAAESMVYGGTKSAAPLAPANQVLLEKLEKCRDVAIASGAHESYQAVREAFDDLRAAILVANKKAGAL